MTAAVRRRVLLAEDDPRQLVELAGALEAAGFEPVLAHDGVEALEVARRQPLAAAVLDLLLRRLDGLRVCELLKRDPVTTNLPVVILSGIYLDDEDARRALAAGADRCLPQPVAHAGRPPDLSELLHELEGVLGQAPGSGPVPLIPATVLVIDDDPENRAFLHKALKRQGAHVLEAAGGEEGLRLLTEGAPALVLLDVRMSGISGLELLPRVRAANPETVMVIMTAFGSEETAAEAVRRGADDYIAKPIDLKRLRELVERNLEKHRLRLERADLMRRLQESNRYLMQQHRQVRLAEEQILAVNRQLEQANRFKSEFLANMSHELRTPLNSIIGFSEILLDPTMQDLGDSERQEFLRNIHGSGQHLLGLINEILDLAKVEAGKMELHRVSLKVADTLAEVAAIIEPLARQAELRLTVDVEPNLPSLVADRGKLKQVLYNLLSNAVKFTPAGGEVTVMARRVEDAVCCSVRDTGIGIHPRDYPKLFREFQQLDGSYARKYEGTGLGLALSKRFVEMHGGRIWAENQPGRGSTFTFAIPLSVPLAGQAGPDWSAVEEVEVAPGRPLVLVVDDDRPAAAATGRLLRQAGYRVTHARTGEDAVRKALSLDPHLIVLEVVLPKKDGWSVLQELKALPATRETPVIIASVMDNRSLAFTLGAADYALKPLDRADFVPRVHRLARRVQELRDPVKVLLVHADREFVREGAGLLVESHFKVFRAESDADAVARLEAVQPDVLVVDGNARTPVLWQRLRAGPRRPHVVALQPPPDGDALPVDTYLDPVGTTPLRLVQRIQCLEVVQRKWRAPAGERAAGWPHRATAAGGTERPPDLERAS